MVSPPSNNTQPIINIDGSSLSGEASNKKQNLSAVDVDFKKDIFIVKPK